MATAEPIILNDKTNNDDPIRELVEELKQTNRALNDLVKEPQRQYQTQHLEEQFGTIPEKLLRNWQSMTNYWTETIGRTMSLLVRCSPPVLLAGAAEKFQQLQHDSGQPRSATR
jgi:hypothetical protein